MKTVNIKINDVSKVKNFVNINSKFDCDLDLIAGKYVIDAKSIMGVFSIDLSKVLQLNIQSDDEDTINEYLEAIDKYIEK